MAKNNSNSLCNNMTVCICLLLAFYIVGCQKNPESNNTDKNATSNNSEDRSEGNPNKANDVSQAEISQKPPLSQPIDFPTPPSGFSWKYCEEIKGALLMPDNWHWKKTNTSNNPSYFITKEPIIKNGSFSTGLSVFVLKDIPSKAKMSPSQYAIEYISTATKEKHSLKQWQSSMGPFKGYGCLLRDVSKDAEPTMLHNLLIANDKTGTIYLVIFESPESSWEKEWKIGEVILARLLIDDTI